MIATTCELWVDGLRVPDGAWMPAPNSTVALSGLSLEWGRTTTVDQPAPSQVTFELKATQGGNPFDAVVRTGSRVLIWAAHGSDRRPVFAGRVTDLDAQFDEGLDTVVCRVIVGDALSDVANRYVGTEPWAGQYAFQRVEKILAAIGNPVAYSMDTGLDSAWLILSRMDVDRQAAQGLLYDIAASTGMVLWSATDTAGNAVLKYEDTTKRPSQSRFLPSGGGVAEVITNPGATDNGAWRSRSDGNAGTATVTYVTGGAGGPAKPGGGNWTTWFRKKWTAAANTSMTRNGVEVYNGALSTDWIPLAEGQTTTVGVDVRITGTYPRVMRLSVISRTGASLGFLNQTYTTSAWRRMQFDFVVPAGHDGCRVIIEAAQVAQGGTPWAVGDQFDTTGLSVTHPGGGGLWGPVVGGGAGGGVAPLDACEVLRDPVVWARSVTDLLTRVTVRWMDQATTPNPTERTVMSVDADAETQYGARGLSIGTILTSAGDAQNRVTALMAANAPSDDWRATGLTIDTRNTVDDTDADAVALVMDLLGAATRNGRAIMLDNLPWWTPTTAAAQLFVEGGHYSYDEGRWLLALNTTPAVGTGNTLTLAQVDRTVRYVDVVPTVRYVDMVGVGP